MATRFDFDDKVALTTENDSVQIWSTYASGENRVFVDKRNQKAILNSDNGVWWEQNKKESANCFYAQFWTGEFPYDSWSWAIRKCKVTGKVTVKFIDTDINPRGLTTSERWERDCKSYVPDTVTA